jgi:hypothetical protein
VRALSPFWLGTRTISVSHTGFRNSPVQSWKRVVNVLGRTIVTMVNETQDAGYHEVKFDGSNLTIGVYLYQLRAETFVETKELLLIRCSNLLKHKGPVNSHRAFRPQTLPAPPGTMDACTRHMIPRSLFLQHIGGGGFFASGGSHANEFAARSDHPAKIFDDRQTTTRSKRVAKQSRSDDEKIHMLSRFSAIN